MPHDWFCEYEGTAVVEPIRVVRGGGWIYAAADCRAANRTAYDPALRSSASGLRMALSPSVKWPAAEQGAKPLGVGTE